MFDRKIIEKEGNKKSFQYKGYTCMILRMDVTEHLCGYVLIPKNNVVYYMSYDELQKFDVHGGIAFNDCGDDGIRPKGYWIGFDCAHACDLLPTEEYTYKRPYRDMEYVTKELEKLVDQIVEEE